MNYEYGMELVAVVVFIAVAYGIWNLLKILMTGEWPDEPKTDTDDYVLKNYLREW